MAKTGRLKTVCFELRTFQSSPTVNGQLMPFGYPFTKTIPLIVSQAHQDLPGSSLASSRRAANAQSCLAAFGVFCASIAGTATVPGKHLFCICLSSTLVTESCQSPFGDVLRLNYA